jgi:ankyrin repeat protein
MAHGPGDDTQHPRRCQISSDVKLSPLLEYGAVVGVQDSSKNTPLHAASASGKVDIMRWLLDHGADPNARNSSSWTPLYRAVYDIRLETVQALL